jgi:hypothetical protein
MSNITDPEYKKIIYSNISQLHNSHHVSTIKQYIKKLSELPQDIEGLSLLENLHTRLGNPYLKTTIENVIETYPDEWLKNCNVRKITRNNCINIEDSILYKCSFLLDKGFFIENLTALNCKREYGEECFSALLNYVKQNVNLKCGIDTHYMAKEQIYYETTSEEDYILLKKCLKEIGENLDLDSLYALFASCNEKTMHKVFECYDLSIKLHKPHTTDNKVGLKHKI